MMEGHDDAAVIRARTESTARGGANTTSSSTSSEFTPLEPYDNHSLQIFVTDPEKHGDGMDAYVSFCVTTKTTLSDFQAQEFFVRRRYTDFVWLRNKLFTEFPNVVIPPVPSKDVAKHLGRFSEEFLEKRRFFLERFLRRCASHPKLSTSKDLYTFLEAKKWALDTAKKEKSEFFSNMKESISKTVAGYRMKNPDERFSNLRNHVDSLSEHLANLEKISSKIKKHESELADDLQEMGPVYTMLANSETELRDVLTHTGQSTDKLAEITRAAANGLESKFINPLHEYVSYAGAAIDLLDKRDVCEYHFITAQQTLAKREAERTSVEASDGKTGLSMFSSKNPEVLKQEKLDKLATQIQEAEQQVREKEQEKNETDEVVLKEFEDWHSRKVKDLKKMLIDYATTQIEQHAKSLKLYEELLPLFENIPSA